MSYKIQMKNGITEAQWIKNNNLVDTAVKLAGEEAKDRLYEPKHKKKLVRVLTVIAYVFFVSLAAIMLSLYYVFLWNGGQKSHVTKFAVQPRAECGSYISEGIQNQASETTTFSTPVDFDNADEFREIMNNYPQAENN